MKIIISGVPCCGKTFFADWLRDNHGFAHANLEPRKDSKGIIETPPLGYYLPAWIETLASNIAVTWGFPPNDTCFNIIQSFIDAGFSAWWFHADHSIARVKYIAREGLQSTELFFDPQIQRLEAADTKIKALYKSNSIETLNSEGYRELNDIFSTIRKNTA